MKILTTNWYLDDFWEITIYALPLFVIGYVIYLKRIASSKNKEKDHSK